MRHNWILLVLMFTLFFCKQNELEGPISIQADQKIEWMQEQEVRGAVVLKLLRIKDNRCPLNAVCVQKGYVDLDFLVTTATDTTVVDVRYRQTDKKPQTTEFQIDNKSYRLTVFEVLPYPLVNVILKPSDYQVYFSLQQ